MDTKKLTSKCTSCVYWVFTPTLGNPQGCYHCESGFSPCDSCKDMCKQNRKARAEYSYQYLLPFVFED